MTGEEFGSAQLAGSACVCGVRDLVEVLLGFGTRAAGGTIQKSVKSKGLQLIKVLISGCEGV